jgi:pimeloyl-ACP methyl ester carboxylesterase
MNSVEVRFTSADVELVGELWEPTPTPTPRGNVLLLHGGGQTRHAWKDTARRVASNGWCTIALDARGHGQSGWAGDGDYSLDALAKDLRLVVQTLGVKPVIVGASMGGQTAVIAEGDGPPLARALVLVDIVARMEVGGVNKIYEFMTATPDGFASLEDAAEAIGRFYPRRAGRGSSGVDGLRKNLREGADGRWRWHWDPEFLNFGGDLDAHQRQMESRLRVAAANICVPTLLLRGADSDIVAPQAIHEMQQLVPGAKYIEVGGTGHMVAGDDNSVFALGLLDFLNQLPIPHPRMKD